jgi:rubredoxin
LTSYRCNVCNVFEYDPERGRSVDLISPGTHPGDFSDDWRCPICGADKSHLKPLDGRKKIHDYEETITCPTCGAKTKITVSHEGRGYLDGYLGEWRRESDDFEVYMAAIHKISATGESIIEPMSTRKHVISWDQILIKGAQLAKIPLNVDEPVNTRTIIGPGAKRPLVIETPIFVTHMSFGALSKEVKISLAKGSAAVKTAIGSGEGGILEECRENSYKYILSISPTGIVSPTRIY